MNRGKSQQLQTMIVSLAGLIISIPVYIYDLRWHVDYYIQSYVLIFTALWAVILVISTHNYYAVGGSSGSKQQWRNRTLIEILLFLYVAASIVTWTIGEVAVFEYPLITASSEFSPLVSLVYLLTLVYIIKHKSTDILLICIPFTVMLLFISPFEDSMMCSNYSAFKVCQEILILALICSLASESLNDSFVKKHKKFSFDDLLINHWLLITEDDDDDSPAAEEYIETHVVSQDEYAVCSLIWTAILIMTFYFFSTDSVFFFFTPCRLMLSLLAIIPFMVLLLHDVRNYWMMALTAAPFCVVNYALLAFYPGAELVITTVIFGAPVISSIYSIHLMNDENIIRIKCFAVMRVIFDWTVMESMILSLAFYTFNNNYIY